MWVGVIGLVECGGGEEERCIREDDGVVNMIKEHEWHVQSYHNET